METLHLTYLEILQLAKRGLIVQSLNEHASKKNETESDKFQRHKKFLAQCDQLDDMIAKEMGK